MVIPTAGDPAVGVVGYHVVTEAVVVDVPAGVVVPVVAPEVGAAYNVGARRLGDVPVLAACPVVGVDSAVDVVVVEGVAGGLGVDAVLLGDGAGGLHRVVVHSVHAALGDESDPYAPRAGGVDAVVQYGASVDLVPVRAVEL